MKHAEFLYVILCIPLLIKWKIPGVLLQECKMRLVQQGSVIQLWVEAKPRPDLTLLAYFLQGLCNCSKLGHLWKKSCS